MWLGLIILNLVLLTRNFLHLQKTGFEIYSEYCNNHPHAMAELKTLCESNKYKQFFEVRKKVARALLRFFLETSDKSVEGSKSLKTKLSSLTGR